MLNSTFSVRKSLGDMRLKKPRRSRAQSAPTPPYRSESSMTQSDCSDTSIATSLFRRRRKSRDLQKDSSNSSIDTMSILQREHSYSNRSLNESYTTRRNSRNHPLVVALVAALQKDHMLDVTLTGQEGVKVKASRYVLACRCQGLEQVLYPDNVEEVHLGDFDETTLKALVEFCFTGELVQFASLLEHEKHVVQVAQLAMQYKFRPLQNEAYQLSRRRMNARPERACLYYSLDDAQYSKDFVEYARQTLQECPSEALFNKKTTMIRHLPSTKLTSLVRDLQDDMSALELVELLQLWLQQQTDSNDSLAVAQSCAASMDLSHVSREDRVVLHESGLFDRDILKDDEQTCLQESQEERVIVHGAGVDGVNGVYIRKQNADDEQALYVKTTGDFGLHLWKDTWHIAPSCDLSNAYYTCESPCTEIPTYGWQAVAATAPSPTCKWLQGHSQDTNDDLPSASRTTRHEDPVPACFCSEEELYGN